MELASICTDVLNVQKDNEMWRFAFLWVTKQKTFGAHEKVITITN